MSDVHVSLGLDQDGYITNPCSADRIQPDFQPVVNAVSDMLYSDFKNKIHSLYLYGSVAQGKALPEISDLDVSVVFNKPLSALESNRLKEISNEIARKHAVVSKLDIDPGYLEEVIHKREKYRWHFWLKHCCCCIAGEDLSKRFSRLKPSVQIAYELNSDLEAFIETLDVEFSHVSKAKRRQILAKKILRTAYTLIAEKDGSWHTELEHCMRAAMPYYPEYEQDLQLALKISKSVLAEDGQVNQLVERLGSKLIDTLNNAKPFSAAYRE
ncbi:putative Nucleotidyltransferase [Vibrio nigripulchritudo SO65]|uniref:nucleotidyltransferase domain-containing protein n=1 Tax=Vibrio nigripulchritudo TaxID=28173 RepID=UPI0003B1DFD8|nr:nucleotidyltransferase domain-containing protein [Vibrio nigripulchritudo]CCN33498.1 putative Nucleotidyltransferase [Vibrio nigripulchritudo AM115]CCN41506.1 putative Nucleotidyltransferase [Vibrio nigripulchritudo FTn2]CCN64183.1 putative Nucleotidyltransferase [Vibrio nigripulchritudo POn4]CCN75751.1 putative Nucleotidyltransferase [Vibrio nigripulchritudo SO65]